MISYKIRLNERNKEFSESYNVTQLRILNCAKLLTKKKIHNKRLVRVKRYK